MSDIVTGGPAFPFVDADADVVRVAQGMTLRDYFIAHAPAAEIDSMVPQDVKGCAAYLGIDPTEYKGEKHFLAVLVKARGEWADAMLAARSRAKAG